MKKTHTLVALLFAIFLFSITANAATYTVTKTADTDDGVCDADCSFREAINADNNWDQTNTVVFASSLSGQTIAVTGAQMSLFQNLTIIGLGANQLTVACQNGQGMFNIAGDNYSFSDMTITGCNGEGMNENSGGAFKIMPSAAVVSINRMNFTGNSAETQGGVLYFQGTTLTISNSTFSGNSSFQCGAISLGAGTTTITNSTFSGNTVSGSAGAICTGGTVNIRNTTIVGNNSDNSGGAFLVNSADVLNISNSVVAGNTASLFPEIWRTSGTVNSLGNNHIGDSAGDSTNTNIAIAWAGTDTVNTNPMLGALTVSNGGNTPTRIPLTGSPLINSGNNAQAPGTFDQRGYGRIVGGTVDKGAVEFSAVAPTSSQLSLSGRVIGSSGMAVSGAEVTVINTEGVMLRARTNPFGYYTLDMLVAGDVYVLSAAAKGMQFDPQVITMNENVTDRDLIAQPGSLRK